MLRYSRVFLICASVVFAVATAGFLATFSPSYKKCKGENERSYRDQKPADLDQTVAVIPQTVPHVSLFLLCEGEFIDQNSGTLGALATTLLFVVTGGLVGIGWLQIRTTKDQLRAHIIVEGFGIDPFLVSGSVAHYSIRNVGQVPARNVQWTIEAEFSSDGVRKDFQYNWNKAYGRWVVAPGIDMRRVYEFCLTETEMAHFKNDSWVLYVWGKVKYSDGFSRDRWIKFCHRYGLGVKVVIPLLGDYIPADRVKYHQYGNDTDDA